MKPYSVLDIDLGGVCKVSSCVCDTEHSSEGPVLPFLLRADWQ